MVAHKFCHQALNLYLFPSNIYMCTNSYIHFFRHELLILIDWLLLNIQRAVFHLYSWREQVQHKFCDIFLWKKDIRYQNINSFQVNCFFINNIKIHSFTSLTGVGALQGNFGTVTGSVARTNADHYYATPSLRGGGQKGHTDWIYTFIQTRNNRVQTYDA
jgi:hypothetical protein